MYIHVSVCVCECAHIDRLWNIDMFWIELKKQKMKKTIFLSAFLGLIFGYIVAAVAPLNLSRSLPDHLRTSSSLVVQFSGICDGFSRSNLNAVTVVRRLF